MKSYSMHKEKRADPKDTKKKKKNYKEKES